MFDCALYSLLQLLYIMQKTIFQLIGMLHISLSTVNEIEFDANIYTLHCTNPYLRMIPFWMFFSEALNNILHIYSKQRL